MEIKWNKKNEGNKRSGKEAKKTNRQEEYKKEEDE